MEGNFGGKSGQACRPVLSDLKGAGKKNLEWDLNDWIWDGDLFTASPLNSAPSDRGKPHSFPNGSEFVANGELSNSLSLGSDEIRPGNEKGKRELEKRRRPVSLEDEDLNDQPTSLNLKLGGGHVYPIIEDEMKDGKKSKIVGDNLNRTVCQVDDCHTDLSNAKDYHRRHKVCNMHSKASETLVGNVMQRFCQQCSRFHGLQEFDEGKRSCRRRLAGHNKRRRKKQPDSVADGGAMNDQKGISYLLGRLLRILSNVHTNNSDKTKDQDLLSHLLKNLANSAGAIDGRSSASLPEEALRISQKILDPSTGVRPDCSAFKKNDTTVVHDPKTNNAEQSEAGKEPDISQHKASPTCRESTQMVPSSEALSSKSRDSLPSKLLEANTKFGQIKLNNIDLNNVYVDSLEIVDKRGKTCTLLTETGLGTRNSPLWIQSDSRKSSPHQTSERVESTSIQSALGSRGGSQNPTERIVLKLFGKDPNEFPLTLRSQILEWLSHSPTELESYIRPGCIILTIYLRLGKSMRDELFYGLKSSLERLFNSANDCFWRTGWVYIRFQHHIAFIHNGHLVVDMPLHLNHGTSCRISSIKPIAISGSERAQFTVKGFNIYRPSVRLLCAFEGKYLLHETCYDLVDGNDALKEQDELQTLRFICSVPDDAIGRGFIEIEDDDLSSTFFPFIVAEPDVCSEIRTLEAAIDEMETPNTSARTISLDFIHELGWLLHRNRVTLRLGRMDPNLDRFSFERFKWLIEFSMNQDWCALVNKLLGIFFEGCTVTKSGYPSMEFALVEMNLLHLAVQRNCRPMVELLLSFVPSKQSNKPGLEKHCSNYLFKPDAVGLAGLTPLHIAASCDGYENVLDALTNDPGKVGIKAWKISQDDTGLTPNDYACLRGHFSYIRLVQKKCWKMVESESVVVEIPYNASKICSLQTKSTMRGKDAIGHCRICEGKTVCGYKSGALVYRPAMLSLVVIAAVCVCVALLFKSSPEVLYIFEPFRWEALKYGSI